MSSRITSAFGPLGVRAERTQRGVTSHTRFVEVDDAGTAQPGLLLEWVRSDAGWLGRVVWARAGPEADPASGPQLIVALVPAHRLRPVP